MPRIVFWAMINGETPPMKSIKRTVTRIRLNAIGTPRKTKPKRPIRNSAAPRMR